MSRLLSARQVADALGISVATVYANADQWGGFRVGKLWKFRSDVLRQIIPQADTLPSPCPDAIPPSPRSNALPASGASDGANMDDNASSVATPTRRRRSRRQPRSATGFDVVFPEYAKSVR